jgi:hypothetical protein
MEATYKNKYIILFKEVIVSFSPISPLFTKTVVLACLYVSYNFSISYYETFSLELEQRRM